MFGTLVVQLPSAHTGGALVVSHDGKRVEIRSEDAPFSLQFAAFYSDCLHEVCEVTKGYRVCLVYNLLNQKREGRITPPSIQQKIEPTVSYLNEIFLNPSDRK